MKYIVDSRYFDGTCLTSMRDGVHSDYGGETLEELRIREKNPHLTVVDEKRIHLLVKRYQDGLQTPFREITEECYRDLFECLPPKRMGHNYFFVGECYFGDLYPFCFKAEGRFYRGERSIRLTKEEICGQIKAFMEQENRHPALVKDTPLHENSGWYGKVITYIPYYFEHGGKRYLLQSLATETGNGYDDRNERRELAVLLLNLRKNRYRYVTFYSVKKDIFEFFDWLRKNEYTLEVHGKLLGIHTDFVDFHGNVCEYSAAFHYRIYSRELLGHIINQLRTVKRSKLNR